MKNINILTAGASPRPTSSLRIKQPYFVHKYNLNTPQTRRSNYLSPAFNARFRFREILRFVQNDKSEVCHPEHSEGSRGNEDAFNLTLALCPRKTEKQKTGGEPSVFITLNCDLHARVSRKTAVDRDNRAGDETARVIVGKPQQAPDKVGYFAELFHRGGV